MSEPMKWPHQGLPKFLLVPDASPFRSDELTDHLRIEVQTPIERVLAVEAMVAAKACEYLTSPLRPTVRQAWLELQEQGALAGMTVDSFLSERTFYRRVGDLRARMERVSGRPKPCSTGRASSSTQRRKSLSSIYGPVSPRRKRA
jgi:hypothetical protein